MILFIQQSAPHGSVIGQEGLDVCLMGSAFTECALLFLGQGLYQIMGQQQPHGLGMKNYSQSYAALADYGVQKLYCRQQDLDQLSLTKTDLCLEVEALEDDAISDVMRQAKQVLTF